MKTYLKGKKRRGEGGFTLIELLVVVLIIGILVAIAIPQYFKVVERSKLGDVGNFASALKQSEERYNARNGVYLAGAASVLTGLDIGLNGTAPAYGMLNFTIGTLVANAPTAACPNGGVSIPFVRNANAPARYGPYTLTYDTCLQAFTASGGQTANVNSDLLPF